MATYKDVDMRQAKSEDQHSLRNKLKVSSTEETIRHFCKECGKLFKKKKILNAHIRAIHEGRKYPCEQCQHQATTMGSLNRHRRAIHEGIKYPCGKCAHQATSNGDLVRHIRSGHDVESQY